MARRFRIPVSRTLLSKCSRHGAPPKSPVELTNRVKQVYAGDPPLPGESVGLCQDLLHDFSVDVGESEITALEAVGEALVVEA